MSYKSINKGKFRFSWKEFGHGKQLILAFHGFNRNPDDFSVFKLELGDHFTILSFDLFAHGRSLVLNTDEEIAVFNILEFNALIEEVLSNYDQTEFYVMAYSFGGRSALNLIEEFKHRVKGVVLIAPDGLRFNPGFYFSTQNMLGHALFKIFVKNPIVVQNLLKLTGILRLYKSKTLHFYLNQIVHHDVREKLYSTWMTYRKSTPNLQKVISITNQYNIPILLFFGKYDTIIPAQLGKRFSNHIHQKDNFYILECGHKVLEKHYEISQIILEKLPDSHS